MQKNIYPQLRFCPGEWDAQISLGFWDTNVSPNRPDLIIINKKEYLKNCGLCCPNWRQNKVERKWKKKGKYLDVAGKLKKLCNMKATVIIVIGTLGTITKGFVKGLEDLVIKGREETIQTKALLRSARIRRKVLETCGDLMSPRLEWKNITKHWGEKLSRTKNNNNKWYLYKPESVLENETYKIQMDHEIPSRRSTNVRKRLGALDIWGRIDKIQTIAVLKSA